MTSDSKRHERIMIFLDFWNFELSIKALDDHFLVDWKILPQVLFTATNSHIMNPNGASFMGLRLYGSYSPSETSLHKWGTGFLKKIPGVFPEWMPRQKQVSGPKCPVCKTEVSKCPHCTDSMLGYKEKGVDTRIATDMIKFAWEDAYDTALLVSADQDFVPVVDFLDAKGKKVLHGRFPPKGAVLSQHCWGQIDIPPLVESFRRS